MTEAVCSAALALAYFGGAKTHVAQPRFTLLCERETPERSDALALALDGDTAELVLPANFSGDARLASASYVDYRLAHVDRNVFAVGDAKQSIYSFQRARPEAFAEMRRVTATTRLLE